MDHLFSNYATIDNLQYAITVCGLAVTPRSLNNEVYSSIQYSSQPCKICSDVNRGLTRLYHSFSKCPKTKDFRDFVGVIPPNVSYPGCASCFPAGMSRPSEPSQANKETAMIIHLIETYRFGAGDNKTACGELIPLFDGHPNGRGYYFDLNDPYIVDVKCARCLVIQKRAHKDTNESQEEVTLGHILWDEHTYVCGQKATVKPALLLNDVTRATCGRCLEYTIQRCVIRLRDLIIGEGAVRKLQELIAGQSETIKGLDQTHADLTKEVNDLRNKLKEAEPYLKIKAVTNDSTLDEWEKRTKLLEIE